MNSLGNVGQGRGVCFISDRDDGGAAVACRRIMKAMMSVGAPPCDWLVCRGGCTVEALDASTWPDYGALLRFETVRRFLKDERLLRAERGRYAQANVRRWLHHMHPRALALFNLHEEAAFDLLAKLPAEIPLVISLQDMWYLTGYCYYSMECPKYETGCKGVCPQMGNCGAAVHSPALEWTRREAWFAANRERIHVVAPSQWMGACAERRFHGRVPVSVIPNCVDTAVFKPLGDKALARQALGLPRDGFLVLSGAVSVDDERKGGRFLIAAVRHLQEKLNVPLRLVLFGSGGGGDLPTGTLCTGSIRDEVLLNLYFNAADLFVLPSQAESFGLVFVEAMAAGTPSVCFDTSGCLDTVLEGKTGFRAALQNVDHLMECIRRVILMTVAERKAMAQVCRETALSEFSFRVVGEAYLRLLNRIMQ